MNNELETNKRFTPEAYCIYLRKSRADMEAEKLGEGETLKRHREILTTLAVRKNLFVAKIYEEIVSGETIEARPEIQQMIKECYDGKYRGIIVIDVDRLSRGNQADMQTIMDCLRFSNNNNGLLVITPTKTYDVAHNPDDEEYMEFVLFMSRREYKTIQKRLERGRKQAVVEGNFMGSHRPYGYDIIKTRCSRTLTPNPEEAPILQKIFEWTANDEMTPGQIAKRLNALGIKTQRGNSCWNSATIKTYLLNPIYIGKVRWNDRMRVKKMVDGELVSSRPRQHSEHYMEYDGKHPALVDVELYEKANSRFYSDKTKGEYKLQNIFAGLLVCPKCGKTFRQNFYRNKTAKPRLYHPTESQGSKCKVKSVAYDDVVDAMIHGLKMSLEDIKIKADNTSFREVDDIHEQIDALNAQIRKIDRILDKLYTAWEDDKLDDNEFVKRKQVNIAKKEEIKNQICELEKNVPDKEDYQERIMNLSALIETLADKKIDAKEKNKFLKEIVEKIYFSRENPEEFVLDIVLK